MSLATIRTAIKDTMTAIAPPVGVVNDYEPYVTRAEDFNTHFKSGSAVKGWTITRESTQEMKLDSARTNERRHMFVIRGYMSLDNASASEKTFQDLVETVCTALRAEENDHLNGTAHLVGPPSVRIAETRTIFGVLVHYAEIAYPVTEPHTF